MFSDRVYKWLENALDLGLSEHEFWDMTLAELERYIDSKKRVMKVEAQERATYDYILGDLIGRSIARVYSSSAKYPEIYDVYPTVFDKEKIEDAKRERTMELSALRFKQFAESFNKQFAEKEAKANNE